MADVAAQPKSQSPPADLNTVATLNNIILNPSKRVTYLPNEKKQKADLQVENPTARPVMFKMKSTRPGLYKMRPVYGVIPSGEKKSVKLIYKGVKDPTKIPLKDRFTIVYTTAPSANVNCEKMWKQHKYQKAMAEHDVRKAHLKIVYSGINDNDPLDDDENPTSKGVIKKNDVDNAKTCIPLDPVTKKPIVILMCRDQALGGAEDDSKSDDENDKSDEENKDAKTMPHVELAQYASTSQMQSANATDGAKAGLSTRTAPALTMMAEPGGTSKMGKTAPQASGFGAAASGASSDDAKTAPPMSVFGQPKNAGGATSKMGGVQTAKPAGLSQMGGAQPGTSQMGGVQTAKPGGLSQMGKAGGQSQIGGVQTAKPGGQSQMGPAQPGGAGPSQMQKPVPANGPSMMNMVTAPIAPPKDQTAAGGSPGQAASPVCPKSQSLFGGGGGGAYGKSQMAAAQPMGGQPKSLHNKSVAAGGAGGGKEPQSQFL